LRCSTCDLNSRSLQSLKRTTTTDHTPRTVTLFPPCYHDNVGFAMGNRHYIQSSAPLSEQILHRFFCCRPPPFFLPSLLRGTCVPTSSPHCLVSSSSTGQQLEEAIITVATIQGLEASGEVDSFTLSLLSFLSPPKPKTPPYCFSPESFQLL